MNTKAILMLAYAQYYDDARIKGYVNILLEKNFKVDVICLEDKFSKKDLSKKNNLNIYFVQKKYQGNSKILYLLNYFLFFFKATMLVIFKYFQKRYNFIHVNNQPDFLVSCALIPKIFGAKIILDMHDIMIAALIAKFNSTTKSFLFKLTKLQTKLSVHLSDYLFCSDDSQKEYLELNGIKKKNFFVFLNLPDKNKFFERNALPANSHLKFVYHGTASHRLGLDLAIEAIERASKSIDVTFTIIGAIGEQKNELINLCRQKGILNNLIIFKEPIPVEELQKELEKYDAGLISNRRSILSEFCMLPVKLMEYTAIGIPSIAPRLKVIQRYFDDEMVSYFNPDDVFDLTNTIIRMSNKEYRDQIVRNSKRFLNKYPWDIQVNNYLKIVESN
ncbi:MAG: glycosyltransferase [Bacteroidetes bacterium]|nr:glycosyltransferase [Bacteroidota bacterium]